MFTFCITPQQSIHKFGSDAAANSTVLLFRVSGAEFNGQSYFGFFFYIHIETEWTKKGNVGKPLIRIYVWNDIITGQNIIYTYKIIKGVLKTIWQNNSFPEITLKPRGKLRREATGIQRTNTISCNYILLAICWVNEISIEAEALLLLSQAASQCFFIRVVSKIDEKL